MKLTNNSIVDTVVEYANVKFGVEMKSEQVLAQLKNISFSETLALVNAIKADDSDKFSDIIDLSSVSEGYSILPRIDKDKYQERDGLEGPIMTKSGKVVYYDPKAGSYYDPDTDMYISYDDWRMLDNENMHKIEGYSPDTDPDAVKKKNISKDDIQKLLKVVQLLKKEKGVDESFSDQVRDFGMFSKGGNAQVQNAIQYILNDFEDAAENSTSSERDMLRMQAHEKLGKELEDMSDSGYDEAMDTDVRERAAQYLDNGIVRLMDIFDDLGEAITPTAATIAPSRPQNTATKNAARDEQNAAIRANRSSATVQRTTAGAPSGNTPTGQPNRPAKDLDGQMDANADLSQQNAQEIERLRQLAMGKRK